jgi:hypothetical protein
MTDFVLVGAVPGFVGVTAGCKLEVGVNCFVGVRVGTLVGGGVVTGLDWVGVELIPIGVASGVFVE